MIRQPIVAGQFYPGTQNSLEKQLNSFLDRNARKVDALGVVSPHAGYMYSGKVAGSVLSRITPKSTYIIMGPNHTGRGDAFSIDTAERWKTPLGEVELDKRLIAALLKSSEHLKEDGRAHAFEHSVEVQIPFLQSIQKTFSMVPIVIAHAKPDVYGKVGRQLAQTIIEHKKKNDVTIIASSDMTHYEPHQSAKEKDSYAIDAILRLDEDALLEKIAEYDISMCGYAPTYVMLAAVKQLGARTAKLVQYQTRGDTSGDFSSVVGYAGIVIT